MAKPKLTTRPQTKTSGRELDKPAGQPVETDENDEPNADASGDSDDELPDENEAVPEPAVKADRRARSWLTRDLFELRSTS